MENPAPFNQLKLTVLCGHSIHSFPKPNPKGNIFYSSVMNSTGGGGDRGGTDDPIPKTHMARTVHLLILKKTITLHLTENKTDAS